MTVFDYVGSLFRPAEEPCGPFCVTASILSGAVISINTEVQKLTGVNLQLPAMINTMRKVSNEFQSCSGLAQCSWLTIKYTTVPIALVSAYLGYTKIKEICTDYYVWEAGRFVKNAATEMTERVHDAAKALGISNEEGPKNLFIGTFKREVLDGINFRINFLKHERWKLVEVAGWAALSALAYYSSPLA